MKPEDALKRLNLKKLEQDFQAKAITKSSISQSFDDRPSQESLELKLIDGRRSQNCSILLSKLKIGEEEVKQAVLTNDQSDRIPAEMVDQLLKYVPSKEEIETLNQYAEEAARMAKADRFFFEMGKIPRYNQSHS